VTKTREQEIAEIVEQARISPDYTPRLHVVARAVEAGVRLGERLARADYLDSVQRAYMAGVEEGKRRG
jgi:hypothetical protein